MDCNIALELLSNRLDAGLSPAQEEELARHMADCSTCDCVAAAVLEIDALLTSTPVVAAPRGLSGAVMARVHRRAVAQRVGRQALLAVLTLALLVVAVALPAMHAVQASSQGNVFALAVAQVGGQLLMLLESLVRPLVTITRTLISGHNYQYVVAWLAAAVLLVLAWVWVVAHVIRPTRPAIILSTTPE